MKFPQNYREITTRLPWSYRDATLISYRNVAVKLLQSYCEVTAKLP